MLSHAPCDPEAAKKAGLKPQYLPLYSAARFVIDGAIMPGCFRPEGDEAYVLFVGEDHFLVPQAVFEPIKKKTI
jgi:hypothetical protein